MGDKVTISKADIAAGDVVVPCAVYLDEATNDTETMSVQFTINSDSADVKNVKFDCFLPVDDYFAEEKEFKVCDASVKTKKYAAFAGEYDDILEEYSAAGKSVAGCDPSQDVAGAKNYFIGYSWTNNGSAYEWLGSKSTDHPVVVFNVTFPKGTAAGDYKNNEVYQKLVQAAGGDSAEVENDFVTAVWLNRNCPQYQQLIDESMNEIREEITKNKDKILANA
jgi:hypothetical protein